MVAYIVFTRVRTRDPAQIKIYADARPKFLAGHNIKNLVSFGTPFEVLEGPGVEGISILEFPTLAEARAWYSSPAYQDASQNRFRGGDYTAIIVDAPESVPIPSAPRALE
jgi:uncharacterized protein (DUF1330 family)